MPDNVDDRITQARDYLAGCRKRKLAELPPSLLLREAAELRRQLGQVLDVLGEVRTVLTAFDWETDDRQYALEQIEQIAGDR
ncbi:MAG TPA: hypothetical protein VGI64_05940 [Streptosporangiaceae bacterium]|jgi:hypothetical protein